MTIRVTIENLEPEGGPNIRVSRETDKTSSLVGTVLAGQKQEFYFWKDNGLVLREFVESPKQLLQEEVKKTGDTPQPVKDTSGLEDTVNAVLRNKDSYPQ